MTDLPAIPVSAAPRPAANAAPRAPEASGDIKQGQKEDGLFHEELSREMSALQGQPSPANDAGNKTEATDRSSAKDVPEEAKDASAAIDASVAALLAGARALPAPQNAMALLAAADAGISDANAAAGAAESVADALSGGLNSRGSRLRGHAKAGNGLSGAEASATAAAIQNGTERAAGNAKTEFALAANAALAESAAGGKILPAAREAVETAAAPDAVLAQRHAAEAAPQAGMSGANAPSQTHQTAAATAAIAAHVSAPGWDRGLGEKVLWMAGQKLQVAELHLNPPELGPLQITLTVNNDQASAQFVSQHASVREAIEAAMPRLREMLAEGGITLGNTNVGAESFRDQAQQDARSHLPRGAAQADMGGAFAVTHTLRATRGLVDIFA